MSDVRFYRALLFVNGCVPLAMLLWDAWQENLGPDSINQSLHTTGFFALLFLVLALAVTPLRIVLGWNQLLVHRRALGLFGFAYALIHVWIYVSLDRAMNMGSVASELVSRTFLQIGLLSLLLLIPLAITSSNEMIKWLTPKRWKLLHRLAYPATLLGVVHYFLAVKSDTRLPIAFLVATIVLLGGRVFKARRKPKRFSKESKKRLA